MWIFFILFDFFSPTSATFAAKIQSCTASNNQGNYHCTESFDGLYVVGWVDASNGWAFSGVLPSHVKYFMERSYKIHQIRMLTGIARPNLMITNFLLEVTLQTLVLDKTENLTQVSPQYKNADTDGYTAVTGATVAEDAGAVQSEDGSIQLR